MAFMMPVVKNDWDIYKSNRSRRSSECSNPQSCRSRKVSECSKSEGPSLSTSPGSDFIVGSPAHRSIPVVMSASRQYSRASSRASQSSLQSPSKSTSSSPPKSASQSSLNKFHNRLVDKLKRSLRSKDSSAVADGTVNVEPDTSRMSSWGMVAEEDAESLLQPNSRNSNRSVTTTTAPVAIPSRSRSREVPPRVASSYPGTGISGSWSRCWTVLTLRTNTCLLNRENSLPGRKKIQWKFSKQNDTYFVKNIKHLHLFYEVEHFMNLARRIKNNGIRNNFCFLQMFLCIQDCFLMEVRLFFFFKANIIGLYYIV